MKIALIDNLDSFTYNLVHYLEGLDCEVEVCRSSDYLSLDIFSVDAIVLSPGPGLPSDHPGMLSVVKEWVGRKPILGVCLGMQALVVEEKGRLINQEKVKHGVAEPMEMVQEGVLLKGIQNDFHVGLYHSWGVELHADSGFEVLAKNLNGLPMAIEDVSRGVYAVQFHPESILTPSGKLILQNFLSQV